LPLHRKYNESSYPRNAGITDNAIVIECKTEGIEKKFNVGIGTCALKVAYDDPYLLDNDLSGIGISVSYVLSEVNITD
jgi:hypothetical protein